jgi:hypothetical protein
MKRATLDYLKETLEDEIREIQASEFGGRTESQSASFERQKVQNIAETQVHLDELNKCPIDEDMPDARITEPYFTDIIPVGNDNMKGIEVTLTNEVQDVVFYIYTDITNKNPHLLVSSNNSPVPFFTPVDVNEFIKAVSALKNMNTQCTVQFNQIDVELTLTDTGLNIDVNQAGENINAKSIPWADIFQP